MTGKFRNGSLLSIVLIMGVLIAGCSSQSPADTTTTVPTTALPIAKFVAGDIIAKTASPADQYLYVITQYDKVADSYTRAFIYKNADGNWGHYINNRTEKNIPRADVEKVYPFKVAHMTLSSIPIVTPTVQTTTQTTPSGAGPTVTGISPASGAADATVSVTITGTNFQSGAIAQLKRAGSIPLAGTGVSVTSSTAISCVFNLAGLDKGSYNVVVKNPDGQSDTMAGIFTVGDAPPLITDVTPTTAALNATPSLTINGQNFKEGVKVSLVQGSSELVCGNPVSIGATKISCNLNLAMSQGGITVTTGDWDVKVLNIDGQLSAIWSQKFKVTNSTA